MKDGWLAWKPGDPHRWADCPPLMIRIRLRAFVPGDWHR